MSRLAVVTGASAGIGKEFCEQLAQRGYDLLLVARDRGRLEEHGAALAQRHGIAAEVFPADLTRDEDVDRLAARIAESPGLALLVNNAGFGTIGTLAETDPGVQVAMLRLHALAPLRLTRAALPVLLRNRAGGVINVSSVASFIYSAGNTNYCATKAYLTTFTEGLGAELAGTGVRAQALCPGFTRSEFHQRMKARAEGRPRFLWLSAKAVVGSSLRNLERSGPTVCVPGALYKVLVLAIRLCPRPLLGWVTRRRRARDVT
ncbi:MAG: SDR family NAD(P)-dependent oxidoreductase [Gemmatimonadales bacterium]